jgi:hypothetical protein
MPGHLQKLVKYGFMAAVELEACRVLEDPAFPAPVDGYVVSFGAFYEQGFSMPLHYFLCSLLRCYNLAERISQRLAHRSHRASPSPRRCTALSVSSAPGRHLPWFHIPDCASPCPRA